MPRIVHVEVHGRTNTMCGISRPGRNVFTLPMCEWLRCDGKILRVCKHCLRIHWRNVDWARKHLH